MNYADIENAFHFVSSQPNFTNTAILCKKTGRMFYVSGYGDSDELPDDIDDDKYVEIPHKNDLDLGKRLVLDLVRQKLPKHLDEVDRIFSRRGAYARYKELLEAKGLLEEWYKFENEQIEAALRQWCRKNGVEIEG